LLDDQDRPLAGVGLSLEARTPSGQRVADRRDMRTTREGEIAIPIPAGIQRIVAKATFEGDAFHREVLAEAAFDLGLVPVDLSFVEPRSSVLDLGVPTHPITIRARSEAGENRIAITLHDDADQVLANAMTDASGLARIELTSAQLGSPGLGKLSARTQGDDARSSATAELAIVRWIATSLTLELKQQGEGGLLAHGTLHAGSLPVARATISIFDADQRHVASLVTDVQGRFAGALSRTELSVAGEQTGEASVSLQARYVNDVPWLGSSESVTREARLQTTLGWRRTWALATPIVIGLLLLALRRRVGAKAAAPLETPRIAGVSPGQALRLRSASLSISIVVVDARTGKPIRDARAILSGPGGSHREAESAASGAIEISARAAGDCLLEVRAEGFRPLACTVRAPHRGEWTRAIVRLESLRDAALSAWQPIAAQLAANVEGASSSTVRETLERAAHHAHVAHDSARVLVDVTEQAAYARATPSIDEVARVEQQAATMARAIEDKRKV
jgi:hypothetical protein